MLISAGEHFKELTVDQIESIGKLFVRMFSESVCTNLSHIESEKDSRVITPPWGVLGLEYSQRTGFSKSNYSSSPALGTLAGHLVRRGLFVAATAGGEDHLTQGEADQQTKSVVTEAK